MIKIEEGKILVSRGLNEKTSMSSIVAIEFQLTQIKESCEINPNN